MRGEHWFGGRAKNWHTIIEEELLYLAARATLSDDGGKDVDEAYVEHFLVKTLIEKFTTRCRRL
jgi:hypothetical protein